MKGNLSYDQLFEIMRDNFEYMQKSPLVKSLRKENRRLAKENKLLMSIIKDFHVSKTKPKPVIIDLSQDEDDDEYEVPPVKIKIEKTEKTDGNIAYELIEKEPVKAKEEEEQEEVEEEEEQEEVEEDEEEEEELVEDEGRDLKGTAGSLNEETEVYEITIRGKKYFTTDQKNGKIYAMDADGEVGDEIGSFVNGVAKL